MEEEDEVAIFSVDETINRERRKGEGKPKGDGKVSELDHAVLGSWKFQSEGVEDGLMFVSGWEKDGKHKEITSDKISQGSRRLWGGVQVSDGSKWFGPRDRDAIIAQVQKVRKEMEGKSYWPAIQAAGRYISEEDLRGITQKWKERSHELETQILELYKSRGWWEERMGKLRDKVDLEFNLEVIKKILNTSEEELKKKLWDFGQLVDNGKLKLVRLTGNLEGVAWNYFKKYAWKGDPAIKNLKEKNLVDIVVKLITGEKVGFDCEKDGKEGDLLEKVFKECKKDAWWGRDKFNVKAVLKSVAPNYSGARNKVPIKDGGGGWAGQYDASKVWREIYSDDFDKSKVLNEKCEPDSMWSWFSDLELKIRQEVSGLKKFVC